MVPTASQDSEVRNFSPASSQASPMAATAPVGAVVLQPAAAASGRPLSMSVTSLTSVDDVDSEAGSPPAGQRLPSRLGGAVARAMDSTDEF